jgi:hypothetical protein
MSISIITKYKSVEKTLPLFKNTATVFAYQESYSTTCSIRSFSSAAGSGSPSRKPTTTIQGPKPIITELLRRKSSSNQNRTQTSVHQKTEKTVLYQVPSSPIDQQDATTKKSAGRSDGEEEETRRRSRSVDIAAASTRRAKAAMVLLR